MLNKPKEAHRSLFDVYNVANCVCKTHNLLEDTERKLRHHAKLYVLTQCLLERRLRDLDNHEYHYNYDYTTYLKMQSEQCKPTRVEL